MTRRMSTDQISFYDENLKKQVEGAYTSDGWSIHVRSVYGSKSVFYNQVESRIDGAALDLLAQKTLSEMAREAAASGKGH